MPHTKAHQLNSHTFSSKTWPLLHILSTAGEDKCKHGRKMPFLLMLEALNSGRGAGCVS